MLLKREVLDAIRDGTVDLVFRRWRRPSVKQGTRLRTAIGVVEIAEISSVCFSDIDEDAARRAGYPDREDLIGRLDAIPTGDIYRIRLRFSGSDPREALRRHVPEAAEIDVLIETLARMDRRRNWTRQTLELVASGPGVRAADLAARAGRERLPFKADVRKLKELGLTESLEVGYRLSLRGEAVLRRLHTARQEGEA